MPTGAGSTKQDLVPKGSMQIKNDYGSKGFGGACPPPGHGVHGYSYTIHALSVENLELPKDASGALTGYMINANTIESSTIESLYKRDQGKGSGSLKSNSLDVFGFIKGVNSVKNLGFRCFK